MFWFSQMIFYNAHIPLLIRQANDVEENPGPTIFEVIDPTKTVCADYSQGNEALFRENAGKQCVAMSPTAIIGIRRFRPLSSSPLRVRPYLIPCSPPHFSSSTPPSRVRPQIESCLN